MNLKYTKESDSFFNGKKKHAKYNGSYIDQYNVLHKSGQPCRPSLIPGTFYEIVSSGQCYNPTNAFDTYFDMIMVVDETGDVYGVPSKCFDLTDTYRSDSEIYDLQNSQYNILNQKFDCKIKDVDEELYDNDEFFDDNSDDFLLDNCDYEEIEEQVEEPKFKDKPKALIKNTDEHKQSFDIDKKQLELMKNDVNNFKDHYIYSFDHVCSEEFLKFIESLVITECIFLKIHHSLYKITKLNKKINLLNVEKNINEDLSLLIMSLPHWCEAKQLVGQFRSVYKRDEKFLRLLRNPQ